MYNTTLFTELFRLLRLKCFSCHRLRIAASRGRLLKVKLMLLDCGRLEDAMSLDARLAARENAVEELVAAAAGSKRGKDAESVELELARQDKILHDLEIDCIALRGADAGCGIAAGAGEFSHHVRSFRASAVAEYFASCPTKSCANCGALALGIKKDGYSKIFLKSLSAKAAVAMEDAGIRYRSATGILRARVIAAEARARAATRRKARSQAEMADGDEGTAEEDIEAEVEAAANAESHRIAMAAAATAAEQGDGEESSIRFIAATEVAAHMQLLWEADAAILRRVFMPRRRESGAGSSIEPEISDGWRSFFFTVLAVPPSRFRPMTRLGESQFEHPQNSYFGKIMKLSDRLRDLGAAGGTAAGVDLKAALSTWMALQDAVNGLMDSARAAKSSGVEPPNGIRQVLEKKEGLFRQNMMGKRVNFAARTVISPDPYLRVDQVGVPLHFAINLHFRQGVTEWNYASLAAAVRNGSKKWPGATHVEDEMGNVTDLSLCNEAKRDAIARSLLVPLTGSETHATTAGGVSNVSDPSDVDRPAAIAAAAAGGLKGTGRKHVYRHLFDDDIVLMNRQPTLHKPSVMAHRARVMKNWSTQQILRFHYANCKSYNADFDGDEMNMHLPQDHVARSEAYHIAATSNQYLSATGGTPLRGLIQDHNAVSAIFTARDTFFTRDLFCQMLFSGLQALPSFAIGGGSGGFGAGAAAQVFDITVPTPALMKPRMLWTGKQVISSLLDALTAHLPQNARSLCIDGKAKVSDGVWGQGGGRKDVLPVGDSTVTVRKNELLTGVLDKNSLGNTSYGLIHAVYEILGPEAAATLLSVLGRLLTTYEQVYAQTCGVGDLGLNPAAEAQRSKLITSGTAAGVAAAAKHCGAQSDDATAGSAGSNLGENVDELRLSLKSKLRGGAAGADSTGAAAVAAGVAIDNVVKSAMAQSHSAIIDACLPFGLAKPFPANQFSLMVTTGSKGSQINHAMIAVGLGQQELEGRRVPFTPAGKTLPCFPAFDATPRSGGYIADRFLTGLRPQEYFYHWFVHGLMG